MSILARTFVQALRDRRGVIAVWFGVMLVPILLLASVGVDFGRGLYIRSQLQAAVDSAALAGAAVYTNTASASSAKTTADTYMANAVTRLTGGASNVSYAITTGATTSSNSSAAYSVTVTATATSSNLLVSSITSALSIGVKATAAKNYVYTATLKLSSFNSSAYDANTIYYYIVPSDGGIPAESALTKMYSNTATNSSAAISVTLTGSQTLGFAMKNVTGGITGYGKNGYGGAQGSTHMFYSHLSPPSSNAYSSVTSDCSLQVVTKTSSIKSSTCLSATPDNAALSCASNAGKTYYYAWNDMGGGSDDKDYNDAVYSVTCAAANSAAVSTGVVLTN